MASHENPLFDPARDVLSDVSSLQALAHPLRLNLLAALRRGGPSTASRLAVALGVSSGLTSYHLRQLARAGFVADVAEADLPQRSRGGRERWWTAVQRSTYLSWPQADEDDMAIATEYLSAVLQTNFDNALRSVVEAGTGSKRWRAASTYSDLQLSLTTGQASELGREIGEILARYPRAEPGTPRRRGAKAVTVQWQVFRTPGQDAADEPRSST